MVVGDSSVGCDHQSHRDTTSHLPWLQSKTLTQYQKYHTLYKVVLCRFVIVVVFLGKYFATSYNARILVGVGQHGAVHRNSESLFLVTQSCSVLTHVISV